MLLQGGLQSGLRPGLAAAPEEGQSTLCIPSHALIPKVILRLKQDCTKLISIIPAWPRQHWCSGWLLPLYPPLGARSDAGHMCQPDRDRCGNNLQLRCTGRAHTQCGMETCNTSRRRTGTGYGSNRFVLFLAVWLSIPRTHRGPDRWFPSCGPWTCGRLQTTELDGIKGPTSQRS